jgi:hypothetical protein
MKKRLAAVVSALCLLSSSAWAVSSSPTHFEDITQYGTFLAPNAPPACPAGQVLTFNGTVYSCVAGVSSASCPAGQVLQSVSAAGMPTCVAPPACAAGQVLTYNGTAYGCTQAVQITCPTGQVLQSVSAGGIPTCLTLAATAACPAGKILQSINNGVPSCAAMPALPTNFSCPSGQAMTGISGTGAPLCVSLPSIPPVPTANPLYVATYTYTDPDSWNNDLHTGLYSGGGGPVADAIWASCQITDPSSGQQISSDALSVACVANVCGGHFGKYPQIAQSNGWCARGDINPACASHMIIAINCEYSN